MAAARLTAGYVVQVVDALDVERDVSRPLDKGKVAPRVVAAELSIAGLVIMAGDTQPMQQSAIRVARYLARLHPDSAPAGPHERRPHGVDLLGQLRRRAPQQKPRLEPHYVPPFEM